MTRKLIAALLLTVAVACGLGSLPGLIDNVAFACEPDDPGCGN